MFAYYILILLGIYTSLASSSNQDSPSHKRIWSVCDNNGSCSCCRNIVNAIQCTDDDEIIKIQNCYCMFYDEEKGMPFLGTCMTSCFYQLSLTRNNSNIKVVIISNNNLDFILMIKSPYFF